MASGRLQVAFTLPFWQRFAFDDERLEETLHG